MQIYNFFFRIIKKCITFALGLGSRQIKRECRANRQQTRCCEFHHNVSFAEDHSTDFILPKNREGIQERPKRVRRPAYDRISLICPSRERAFIDVL